MCLHTDTYNDSTMIVIVTLGRKHSEKSFIQLECYITLQKLLKDNNFFEALEKK